MPDLEAQVRERLGPRWALRRIDGPGDEPLYDGMETDFEGTWLHVDEAAAAVARALDDLVDEFLDHWLGIRPDANAKAMREDFRRVFLAALREGAGSS